MLEELKELFTMVTGEDIPLDEKTKIDNLGVNSLVKIQLVCAMEEKYGVEITNSEIKKFKTLKNIIDFLESAR